MSQHLYSVCSFESRRQEEMARLIERSGGLPTVAASMREAPLSDHDAAFKFAAELLAGRIDVVVFTTGVGAETLFRVLETRQQDQLVKSALAGCIVAVRGPKPFSVLSRLKVRVDIRAPEPNTWEDLVREMEAQGTLLSGKLVAVQEYGEPNLDFLHWLSSRGAEILRVPIYQWALPEDLGPLQAAVRRTIAGGFDVLLWTSAQQVTHVLEVASRLQLRETWLEAANRCAVGSIGPSCSERLRTSGLNPDLEPTHPKMAHLVRETLSAARDILKRKCLDRNA
jgi:uroporphyrinogen-III synthase